MVYRGGPRPFVLLKFFFFVFMGSSPPLVGAARNESALAVGWGLEHEVVLRVAGSRDRCARVSTSASESRHVLQGARKLTVITFH